MVFRLFLWLAPEEKSAEEVAPLTLLLRPGPLMALVLLAVNDHALKGSGILPTWLTGKLSDFAGLLFFPLLLVTLLNLLFYLTNRLVRRSFVWSSPSHRQIATACLLAGFVFAGVQVWEPMANGYSLAMGHMQFWNEAGRVMVTQDPWDLLALPSLYISYRWGLDALRQLPPGRLRRAAEKLAQARSDARWEERDDAERFARIGLADVYALQTPKGREILGALIHAMQQGESGDRIDALLQELRSPTEEPS